VYDYIIKKALKKYPSDAAFDKKKVGEEVGPFIAEIKNPIIQSHYVKKLAKSLEISEDSVQTLIRNYQKKTKKPIDFLPKALTQPKKQNRDELVEKYILARLFQSEKIYATADILAQILAPEDFSTGSMQKIFRQFLQYKSSHPEGQINQFCDGLPAELQPVCNELFLYEVGDDRVTTDSKALEKAALNMKKEALKRAYIEASSDPDEQERPSHIKAQLEEVDKRINML
jgi:DNA primase